ncbi:MAG: hypothetical protein KDB61_15930, partial [Planctomycetes bacterium]|nr:hypothetical protein [Planctomycetota bacterium]
MGGDSRWGAIDACFLPCVGPELLRGYGNGMARFLGEAVGAAMADWDRRTWSGFQHGGLHGAARLMADSGNGEVACAAEVASGGRRDLQRAETPGDAGSASIGGAYTELRGKAGRLLVAWPLSEDLRRLLEDFCLGAARGRALALDFARLAVRLAPSVERRLALVWALNRAGGLEAADGRMARVLSRRLSPAVRGRAWLCQSAAYLDRGLWREAHVAARIAAA